MDERVTCVVADDHPPILQSICERLQELDINVVALASDGIEAQRLIELHEPQIALVDIEMPGQSGIDTARAVLRKHSPMKIRFIFYTAFGEQAVLQEAVDVGARGFIKKEGPLRELGDAVRQVVAGEVYMDPGLSYAIASSKAIGTLRELTTREREVLRLLADGHTNDEAGKALFISGDTVRTHVRHAMAKLDADTRTQAVATALRLQKIA